MTYSIKLLYEIIIIGEPKAEMVDEFYNDISTFYEQSIVMLKANSFDEAYEKIEPYAKDQESNYINKYGQTVEYRFYDYFDCFEVIEDVAFDDEFVECYSSYFYKDIDKADRYKEEVFAEKMLAQAMSNETHKLRSL